MWLEGQEAGTGLFCGLCAPAEGARVLFCILSSGQKEPLLLVTSTITGSSFLVLSPGSPHSVTKPCQFFLKLSCTSNLSPFPLPCT